MCYALVTIRFSLSYRRIIVGLILLLFVTVYAGSRFLRGDLLGQDDIALNMKALADVNNDDLLTTREIRTALVKVIQRVVVRDPAFDINGDGTVNQTDISVAIRAFRALLLAICGNDVRDVGEQCDDGNLTNGDGCSASCRNEKPQVTLFAMDGWLTQWESSSPQSIARLIGEGVDVAVTRGMINGGYIHTRNRLVTSGTSPTSGYISLSRTPANLRNVTGIKVRLVGDRGIYEQWGFDFKVRLVTVTQQGITPLTTMVSLPSFPSFSDTNKMMAVDLIPLPHISAAQWSEAKLEISNNLWCYSNCNSLPSSEAYIYAAEVSLELVCDGSCDSVTPACGNGILEQYANADEDCDDGDDENLNFCSNACKETGNWWIEELRTVGPRQSLVNRIAPGPLHIVSPDEGFIFWYDDYITYQDVYDSLLVSSFTRDHGWSLPKKLNPNNTNISNSNNPESFNGIAQTPRVFADDSGRISLFFKLVYLNNYYRSDYDPATRQWKLSEPYPHPTYFETGRMDGNKGLVLLNLPLQGSDWTTQYFHQGLYAIPYSAGAWGAPRLLLKFEELPTTIQRINDAKRIVGSNHDNVLRQLNNTQGPATQSAEITELNGDTYSVSWYGVQTSVKVVP